MLSIAKILIALSRRTDETKARILISVFYEGASSGLNSHIEKCGGALSKRRYDTAVYGLIKIGFDGNCLPWKLLWGWIVSGGTNQRSEITIKDSTLLKRESARAQQQVNRTLTLYANLGIFAFFMSEKRWALELDADDNFYFGEN